MSKESGVFSDVVEMQQLFVSSRVLNNENLPEEMRAEHEGILRGMGISGQIVAYFGQLPLRAYLDTIDSLLEKERNKI